MTSRQWMEDPIMGKIKQAAMKKGNNGVREFTRSFRSMDADGSGKLSLQELGDGLAALGVPLTAKEVRYIMIAFDKDGDKQLDLGEFLQGMLVSVNPRRRNVVTKAFLALDRDGSGSVDLAELRARYSAETQPAVLRGDKTADEVTREFLEAFDDDANPDGRISKEEFMAYYAGFVAFCCSFFDIVTNVHTHTESAKTSNATTSSKCRSQKRFVSTTIPARASLRLAHVKPTYAHTHTHTHTHTHRTTPPHPHSQAYGNSTLPSGPLTAEEVHIKPARPVNDRDYDTTHMLGGRAPEPTERNKYLPHTWETTNRADFGYYTSGDRRLTQAATSTTREPAAGDGAGMSMTGDPVLDRVRAKVLKRAGKHGFRGLSRALRTMDDNGNRRLCRDELKEGLAAYRLSVTSHELDVVMRYFDRDGDGQISVTEFVRGVRGPMQSERRLGLVKMAFARLDRDGSGVVELDELFAAYDVMKHPDVLSGAMSPDEAMQGFIGDWDSNADGRIALDEFVDYYGDLSAGIDNDNYFELMIRNAWHISGGTGVSANTTCRRVLVTYLSGKQAVREIKDDLGIRADDIPRMLRALEAQGEKDIKSIALAH